ncbi:MAG: hypothetical protein AAFO75_05475 [Pseudomonadota bacterium]
MAKFPGFEASRSARCKCRALVVASALAVPTHDAMKLIDTTGFQRQDASGSFTTDPQPTTAEAQRLSGTNSRERADV